MNTKMIGVAVALGLGLFACAVPAEEAQGPAADGTQQAPIDEKASEKTGEVSAELKNTTGPQCGSSCSSAGNEQTCCCSVGDRCVATLNTCYCEKATRWGGIGVVGGGGRYIP